MKPVGWAALALALAGCANAAPPGDAPGAVGAPMTLVTAQGAGAAVGTVTLKDGPSGVLFLVDLHGLPPGPHGMHVHEHASCAPGPDKTGKVVAAGAAGGHYDPAMKGVHAGPDGMGHLGDLPLLTVAADGTAHATLTAPHVASVQALRGRALMIHAGGDNYADTPAPLGGGGGRIACGVIG